VAPGRRLRRRPGGHAVPHPALFHQVAREDPRPFAPLRCLLFGGEVADPEGCGVAAAAPPGQLLKSYGPTESTTSPCPFGRGGPVEAPLQTPRACRSAADQQHRGLCPRPLVATAADRVPGELCLRRGGVGPRLSRPAGADGGTLRPHPLADRPEPALPHRRSGPRPARRRPRLPGRLDGQVKVRGFRIELARWRRPCGAIRRSPRPWRCAPGRGERLLVGYVVSRRPEWTGALCTACGLS